MLNLFLKGFMKKKDEQVKDSVTVVAVIRDNESLSSESKILLGKRKDTQKWSFVGGGKEDNETQLQAVLREVREEVGLSYTENQVKFKKSIKTDTTELFIYDVILQDLELVNVENDVDGEFSEAKLFCVKDLVDCKIDLQYGCNENNVVLEYLKELFEDISFDSIDNNTEETLDGVALSFSEKRALQKDILGIREKLSKEKLSFSEKRALQKELLSKRSKLQGVSKKSKADEIISKIAFLRKYMPQQEIDTLVENRNFDIIEEVYKTITTMPKTYETDGQGSEAIAHLHYFKGGSDWYIIENDKEKVPKQAFGFTVLNGDYENAELGYISITELVKNDIELDLYFNPKSIKEIKENVLKKDAEVTEDLSNDSDNAVLKEALDIVSDKNVSYKDLKFFNDDVIKMIENEIEIENSVAIEVENETKLRLDEVSSNFNINSLDSVATADGIEETKISELLEVVLIERLPNSVVGRAKVEDALQKLKHIMNTNKSSRDLIKKVIENIEDDKILKCEKQSEEDK